MKKGLLFGLLLLTSLLGGCNGTETTGCGTGYHLEDDQCVPVETSTCGIGYHLDGDQCVPDITTEAGCSDNELEVGDECILLTSDQWRLYNALADSIELTNLTMLIDIVEGDMTAYATLKLDGTSTMYEDANETVTVVQADETCTVYVEEFGSIEASVATCPDQPYLFFRDFTYDMFTSEDTVFYLNESDFSLLDAFVGAFETAVIDEFILQADDDQITQMELLMTADGEPVQILFEITDVNQTVIDIPVME